MVDALPVQYLRTSDGCDLAYFEAGQGRPLVVVPSLLNSLHFTWSRFGQWFRPLPEQFRYISYDPRGQGLSTRGLPPDMSMAHYVSDLEQVLDHLNLGKSVLISHGFGGHVAVRYAAAHPERVAALILATVTVEISAWNLPFWVGVAGENWELFLRNLAPRYLSEEELRSWLSQVKENVTHADYMRAQTVAAASRIDDALSLLSMPTLVMHPKNYVMVNEEEAAKVARGIRNARLVMLNSNGQDFLGDPAEFVAAITAFMGSLGPDEDAAGGPPVVASGPLSPREAAVLRLVAAGRSNQQIADELVLSINTVRRHVSNIFDKTGVANRAQAAVYARDHGLA